MQFGATNLIVDVADSLDTATCHSYFFLFQGLGPRDHPADQQPDHQSDQGPGRQPDHPLEGTAAQVGPEASPEFPLQVISCGRYFDTYRYHGEAWQIVAREIYADFAGDASRHMCAPVS
jgi:hypothetical protein